MDTHWKDETLNLILLDILRQKGFSKTNKYAFEILKEVMIENLKRIMLKVKSFAEMDQRSEVTVFDLLNVLNANEYDLHELEVFIHDSQNKFDSTNVLISSILIRGHQRLHWLGRILNQIERVGNWSIHSSQTKENIIEFSPGICPLHQRQREEALRGNARQTCSAWEYWERGYQY